LSLLLGQCGNKHLISCLIDQGAKAIQLPLATVAIALFADGNANAWDLDSVDEPLDVLRLMLTAASALLLLLALLLMVMLGVLIV
jgi:hypothetical protein